MSGAYSRLLDWTLRYLNTQLILIVFLRIFRPIQARFIHCIATGVRGVNQLYGVNICLRQFSTSSS